jgi:hypothetical protein
MHEHSPGEEKITAKVDLERHGQPTESVSIAFIGQVDRPEVARKIATLLELEAAEILEELSNPDVLHPKHHHGKLKLACVDLHFESQSARHHFLRSATWARVHQWGCKRFRVSADVAANLELHRDSPTGPVLNEAKKIGHVEGCASVWMVKPGPERNG